MLNALEKLKYFPLKFDRNQIKNVAINLRQSLLCLHCKAPQFYVIQNINCHFFLELLMVVLLQLRKIMAACPFYCCN